MTIKFDFNWSSILLNLRDSCKIFWKDLIAPRINSSINHNLDETKSSPIVWIVSFRNKKKKKKNRKSRNTNTKNRIVKRNNESSVIIRISVREFLQIDLHTKVDSSINKLARKGTVTQQWFWPRRCAKRVRSSNISFARLIALSNQIKLLLPDTDNCARHHARSEPIKGEGIDTSTRSFPSSFNWSRDPWVAPLPTRSSPLLFFTKPLRPCMHKNS